MRTRRGTDAPGGRASRRVAVTLDEAEPAGHDGAAPDEPADGPPAADPPSHAAAHDDRPSGGRRWAWLAVPVVVVVALVVAQVVTDARDRARLAEVARVPGVVRALDGPAELAWRATPGTHLEDAVRAGEVLVVPRVGDDHAVTLEGLDVATGAVRWQHEVVGPRTAWSDWAGAAPTPCDAVPDRTGEVVCLVTDAGGDVVDGVWTALPATTTRLLVLDVTDGTVVAEHPVPAPAAWVTVAGSDALVSGAAAGVLHVRSVGLTDGDERWSATAELGDSADTDVRSTLLDDGTLAVVHPRAATLVSTGGAVLRTVGLDAVTLQTGGSVVTRVETSTTLGAVLVGHTGGTALVTGVGEQRFDGAPVLVTVDDGSLPGLVLTRTPRLVAWDADDGTRRWEARVVDAQDVTVLHGRVHVGTSNAVVTLDGATGETLWRVRRPSATSAPVTDGRYLYVLGSRGGRHSSPYDLVALHPADGSEAWRAPMPDDVAVTQVAGLLVLRGYEEGGAQVYQVLR